MYRPPYVLRRKYGAGVVVEMTALKLGDDRAKSVAKLVPAAAVGVGIRPADWKCRQVRGRNAEWAGEAVPTKEKTSDDRQGNMECVRLQGRRQ
jgi:hypothetical protein